MGRQVAVVLSDDELARIDAAIAAGRYPSRPAALRAGLSALLDASVEPADNVDEASPVAVRPWPLQASRAAVPALLRPGSPALQLAKEVAVPLLTSAVMTLAGRAAGGLVGRVGSRAGDALARSPRPVRAEPAAQLGNQWSRAAYRSTVELFLVRRPFEP